MQYLHPDWEFKTWRDTHRPEDFELGSEFAFASHGAQLADPIRLEVLWRLGGIYLDSDMEPMRSLEPLRRERVFICTEDGRRLTTGAMGAEQGHLGVRACIDIILTEERVRLPPANSGVDSVGTDAYRKFNAHRLQLVFDLVP